MAGISPESQAVGARLFLCVLMAGLVLGPCGGFAQSAAVSSGQNGAASVHFQILDQKRVYFGQHSVTLNRVETPVFPAPVPTPTPAPTPASPLPVFQPALNQELFFSATVYDHQFTVLRWFDGDRGLAVVSNLDFNYFTTYAFFDIFMALDNESSTNADPTTAAWLAQARASLPANAPRYVVVSGTATADDIQQLDALNAYVVANSSNIVQAYQQQQALDAAQALQLKLHPPVRPNTVINYWPIKSSIYLTGSSR